MRPGGFTLIEIVVVLLILGVIAAVSVPAVNSLEESQSSSERAALEIAKLLRSTRRTALNHAVAISVVLDPVLRTYRIETEHSETLSDTPAIDHEGDLDLPAGTRFVGDPAPRRFRFDRLGSGRGPVIHLESEDGTRASVGVTPWTGESWVEAYESAPE